MWFSNKSAAKLNEGAEVSVWIPAQRRPVQSEVLSVHDDGLVVRRPDSVDAAMLRQVDHLSVGTRAKSAVTYDVVEFDAHQIVLKASVKNADKDRRQFVRARFSTTVPVRVLEGTLLKQESAQLENLSAGGCRVFVRGPVPAGQQVEVDVPIPPWDEITVCGKVVRCLAAARDSVSGFVLAIEFDSISAEQRHAVQGHVMTTLRVDDLQDADFDVDGLEFDN